MTRDSTSAATTVMTREHLEAVRGESESVEMLTLLYEGEPMERHMKKRAALLAEVAAHLERQIGDRS